MYCGMLREIDVTTLFNARRPMGVRRASAASDAAASRSRLLQLYPAPRTALALSPRVAALSPVTRRLQDGSLALRIGTLETQRQGTYSSGRLW